MISPKGRSEVYAISVCFTGSFLLSIIDQVLWDGSWQDGAACSTGEEGEQVNSHMSRLGNTTKHMLPEREFTLYMLL